MTSGGTGPVIGPFIGVIADDFTGASDIAGILAREGARTLQVVGMPERVPPGFDAVVASLGIVVPTLKKDRPRLVAALQVAAQSIGRNIA